PRRAAPVRPTFRLRHHDQPSRELHGRSRQRPRAHDPHGRGDRPRGPGTLRRGAPGEIPGVVHLPRAHPAPLRGPESLRRAKGPYGTRHLARAHGGALRVGDRLRDAGRFGRRSGPGRRAALRRGARVSVPRRTNDHRGVADMVVRVMATGVFDLLHPGHVFFLTEARKLGDELVVVVARDQTARRLKREPYVPEHIRREMVGSLKPVDRAVLGSATDIYETVINERPNIIVLGYDQVW